MIVAIPVIVRKRPFCTKMHPATISALLRNAKWGMIEDPDVSINFSAKRRSTVRGIIIRWAILTVAIAAMFWIMQGRGITVEGGIMAMIGIAAVYGLVNAVIKPIVTLLTCPFVILTLGLFMLVINTLMLMLTGWIVPNMTVDGFWPAFWGSVIISIVSFILSTVISDN